MKHRLQHRLFVQRAERTLILLSVEFWAVSAMPLCIGYPQIEGAFASD